MESVQFIPNKNYEVKNISSSQSMILGMGDSKQFLHQLTYKELLDPYKDVCAKSKERERERAREYVEYKDEK